MLSDVPQAFYEAGYTAVAGGRYYSSHDAKLTRLFVVLQLSSFFFLTFHMMDAINFGK